MDNGSSCGGVRKARVTDAAEIQRLIHTFAERDEMLPRSQPAVEHIRQERAHDRLPAQAVVAFQRFGTTRRGHDRNSGMREEQTNGGND